MSVITVALIVFSIPYDGMSYGTQIGGLNQTEFEDLSKIAGTPNSVITNFDGNLIATWQTEPTSGNSRYQVYIPPVARVTGFLQRIKLWGYKITFYDNYLESVDGSTDAWLKQSPLHQWIMEKDSPIIVLPPPLPTTTITATPRPLSTSTSSTTEIIVSWSSARTTEITMITITEIIDTSTTDKLVTSTVKGSKSVDLVHSMSKLFLACATSLHLYMLI